MLAGEAMTFITWLGQIVEVGDYIAYFQRGSSWLTGCIGQVLDIYVDKEKGQRDHDYIVIRVQKIKERCWGSISDGPYKPSTLTNLDLVMRITEEEALY